MGLFHRSQTNSFRRFLRTACGAACAALGLGLGFAPAEAEAQIGRQLEKGDLEYVKAALIEMSQLPSKTVNQMLGTKTAKAMLAIAWKAGLSMKMAVRLQLELARVNRNDIYLKPGVYQQLNEKPGGLDAVMQAVTKMDGIVRVLRKEQVAGQEASADADIRAAAIGYVAGRSGDLIMILKPGWMFSTDGTTHGSNTPDDQRVPLLFFGKGIKHGTFTDASTPADLAPTLAKVVGITMPKAEGHALTVALTAPSARPAK